MTKSKTFKVLDAVFCEYLSTDVAGKNHNLGIIPLEAQLGFMPQHMPSFFLSVTVEALAKKIKYGVQFLDPKQQLIVSADFAWETDDKLQLHQVLTGNVQIPPIPFPGEGEYVAKVKDERGEIVYSRPLFVRVGEQDTAAFKASINVALGPAYASHFPSARDSASIEVSKNSK